jgi:hypothetical protein
MRQVKDGDWTSVRLAVQELWAEVQSLRKIAGAAAPSLPDKADVKNPTAKMTAWNKDTGKVCRWDGQTWVDQS